MSDNIEEILDQLTCPICFLYPKHQVFQCKNGHPICSCCIQSLENCPQCQLPFGASPIRCRLMESLLDSVKLPCANKDSGCTQAFLRKDLPDHHKICEFRSVSLCKWMGYECTFTASTVAPLINHLETCHNARRWKGIVWKKFAPVNESRSLYLQECAANSDPRSAEKTWVVILYRLTFGPNQQKLMSCVPIHLHDGHCSAEHQVHLSVYVENELRVKNHLLSKWTGFPSNYKDAEEDIFLPSFRLSTNYITKQALKLSQLTEFDLTLRFTVEVKPMASV